MESNRYTESLTNYNRRKTVTVKIGDIPMGSDYPIRIQSMANTHTCEVEESLAQCIRLIQAGADYVRFTVPSIKEAACLQQIHQQLNEADFKTPLIADIHFNAAIADKAAAVVEKVRINPGNYAISRKPGDKESGTKEAFKKLLAICKEYGTAIRIGVNHGSLSPDIIDQYGDTPEGMAISAMEFLRLCREEAFDQVVVSMKSSNILVMVQATRLVVSKMMAEGMYFPLHLGVTEAGEGEDGRIRSAAGTGVLLADGIGDTIRVSLTEDPVAEIPVAKILTDCVENLKKQETLPELLHFPGNPYTLKKRDAFAVRNIGGNQVPVVIGEVDPEVLLTEEVLAGFGWHYEKESGSWNFDGQVPDYIFANKISIEKPLPVSKGVILPASEWDTGFPDYCRPLYTASQYLQKKEKKKGLHFLLIRQGDIDRAFIDSLKINRETVLIYSCLNKNCNAEIRVLLAELGRYNSRAPVVVKRFYQEEDLEHLQVKSAFDIGGAFVDGMSNGIWLSGKGKTGNAGMISTAFGILQACRARITRTEYIACPSCGRTNFDIMKRLAEIKKKTSHLKGLKIGVMGCIVNGPGEMADADYGYVGSGKGKITLYKAKKVIRKSIPEENAVDELIALIRENGDWQEP